VADIHQGVDPLTAALANRKLYADLVALEHRAVRAARRKGEPLSEAEDAQLAELRRWHQECEDAERFAQAVLRQALGDGDLPSEIMLANGRLTPVRPEAWRTNDAPLAFENGRLRWRFDSWQAAVIEGPVMIPKAAFAAWLRSSAKPDVAQAGEASAPRPPLGQMTAAGGVAATVAAERRLQAWLEEQMRASPSASPGKKIIAARAKHAGHLHSGRPFARAYHNAVVATGAIAWSAPGRKSPRRIETPD
jgi:hypothetical protein